MSGEEIQDSFRKSAFEDEYRYEALMNTPFDNRKVTVNKTETLGFAFKNPARILGEQFNKLETKEQKALTHGIMGTGGLLLAVSGLLTGQYYTAATGGMNMGRNAAQLVAMFKSKDLNKTEIKSNMVSAGTNSPQFGEALLTGNMAEAAAAGAVMVAYLTRTLRFSRDHRAESLAEEQQSPSSGTVKNEKRCGFNEHAGMSKGALALNNTFFEENKVSVTKSNLLGLWQKTRKGIERTTDFALTKGPAAFMVMRGALQTLAGIGIGSTFGLNPVAIGAGVLFTSGAIIMSLVDMKKQKRPTPDSTATGKSKTAIDNGLSAPAS